MDIHTTLTADPTPATTSTDDQTCPRCLAAAVNVQGIRTCATCEWVERRAESA